jgi:chaperonin cofactor prefoldin
VGGILILAEGITQRKQMEEALSDMSRKLIESQEQERAHIGRELHDDINQRLAMLSLELEQLQENPSEIQPRVKELRRQVAEVSNDVQALSHHLHSSKAEYWVSSRGSKAGARNSAGQEKIGVSGQEVKVVKTHGKTYEGRLSTISETKRELDRTAENSKSRKRISPKFIISAPNL